MKGAQSTAYGPTANIDASPGQMPPTPVTPSMPQETQILQHQLQVAHNHSLEIWQERELPVPYIRRSVLTCPTVMLQRKTISNLTEFNHRTYRHMEALNDRVNFLDSENQQLRRDLEQHGRGDIHRRDLIGRNVAMQHHGYRTRENRTPSNSPEPEDYSDHEQAYTAGDRRKNNPNYAVGSPEGIGSLTIGDSPPARPARSSLPNTPRGRNVAAPSISTTPGRTNMPRTVANPGYTLLNKRKVHNLTTMLPPAYTLIPFVPLTDTEIVV